MAIFVAVKCRRVSRIRWPSEVAQFVEKPNLETAQAYVASGEYYWNSGMFLFRAGRYLEELKKYRSDILDACEKAMSAVDPDLDSFART
ncbi:sugar phosphate nucleotidyltransferase [Escherichia coli]